MGNSGSTQESANEPVSNRRINAAGRLLTGDPYDAVRVLNRLDGDELANLGEVVRQLQQERALARGDLDAIIENGFETGFTADGFPLLPWIEGGAAGVIVCPGGVLSKSRSSHRCSLVSVEEIWIWDSTELIREDKRSNPGRDTGFRAVALLPVITGMKLDVVIGRARSGQHSVDSVISYEIKASDLVEVSQRSISQRRH